MTSIGIIGGGIAGLVAAWRLAEEGHAVTLFEATGQPGGVIRSERTREGYLVEHGPNTIQRATPLLGELIGALGLTGAVVEADAAAKKRYVVFGGRPVALPSSVAGLLTTPLFSPRAKLRLLAEPLASEAPESEESVADFVRRRLGSEILDYAVNPFVAGVYAGDPETLSLRHAFPRLYQMEAEHGSLFKGGLRRLFRKEEEKEARRMFSFAEGLQTLPRALADALGERIRYHTPVTALRRTEDGWTLTAGRDAVEHRFDAVVFAAPLHRLTAMDFAPGPDLAPLEEVSYPPVSLVALGVERAQIKHPLDGFGLLVPEVEDELQILGTLFSSTLFPDRAPSGRVLLTTFVGGARHPALGRADEDALADVVQHDLGRLLGLSGDPKFVRHVRWARAIPQYALGYGRVQALLDRLEAECPGFYLAGNYRAGVSVGDAAASGDDAARRLTEHAGVS